MIKNAMSSIGLLFVVSLLIVGCVPTGNNPILSGDPVHGSLSYIIRGCAGHANEKGFNPEPTSLYLPEINVSNNSIHYGRAISHMCQRYATVHYNIRNNKITLNEVWEGEGAKCLCWSEITADVTGIKPGNYTVEVYATGKDTSGKPVTPNLIISKQINI
jgi:hypothetical protein